MVKQEILISTTKEELDHIILALKDYENKLWIMSKPGLFKINSLIERFKKMFNGGDLENGQKTKTRS